MKNFALPFRILFIFVLVCLSVSCKKTPSDPNKKLIPTSVTDIDGNVYQVKRVANKLWMTENLRVTRYDTESPHSGDTIAKSTNYQGVDVQIAYLYDARNFKESPTTDNLTDEMRKTLGLLYNWCAAAGQKTNDATAASNAQGICPNGWHLPTSKDLDTLCLTLGGKEVAGEKLKSNSGWFTNSGSGTNESELNCYPAGLAIRNNPSFVGKQTMFWSSTSIIGVITKADVLRLSFDQDNAEVISINKIQANSVRCVLDLDDSYIGF
jgi:uncharacterized protein (TIGR02145 family)